MAYTPEGYVPQTEFERYVVNELDRLANEHLLMTTGFSFDVQTAEPARPRQYMVVLADGVSWDPLSLGRAHLVVYTGSAWVAA